MGRLSVFTRLMPTSVCTGTTFKVGCLNIKLLHVVTCNIGCLPEMYFLDGDL